MPAPAAEGRVSLESRNASEVSQFFLELSSRFRPGVATRSVVYYFSIEEEKWTVTVSADRCEVAQGESTEKADCFLKTSAEIFLATVRGDYRPSITDVISGKIRTNNPILLAGFRKLFSQQSAPPTG
jgi:putative sterol carrier protein